MKTRRRDESGFTLIELMICVAIIGIIAGTLDLVLHRQLRSVMQADQLLDHARQAREIGSAISEDLRSLRALTSTPEGLGGSAALRLQRRDGSRVTYRLDDGVLTREVDAKGVRARVVRLAEGVGTCGYAYQKTGGRIRTISWNLSFINRPTMVYHSALTLAD